MSIKNLSGSCAAGRWIYRTDTGDETGKVVESAEYPVKEGWYLCMADNYVGYLLLHRSDKCNANRTNLRKHLIAYAEIRR